MTGPGQGFETIIAVCSSVVPFICGIHNNAVILQQLLSVRKYYDPCFSAEEAEREYDDAENHRQSQNWDLAPLTRTL